MEKRNEREKEREREIDEIREKMKVYIMITKLVQ